MACPQNPIFYDTPDRVTTVVLNGRRPKPPLSTLVELGSLWSLTEWTLVKPFSTLQTPFFFIVKNPRTIFNQPKAFFFPSRVPGVLTGYKECFTSNNTSPVASLFLWYLFPNWSSLILIFSPGEKNCGYLPLPDLSPTLWFPSLS